MENENKKLGTGTKVGIISGVAAVAVSGIALLCRALFKKPYEDEYELDDPFDDELGEPVEVTITDMTEE
jgi:hypothetical protein